MSNKIKIVNLNVIAQTIADKDSAFYIFNSKFDN